MRRSRKFRQGEWDPVFNFINIFYKGSKVPPLRINWNQKLLEGVHASISKKQIGTCDFPWRAPVPLWIRCMVCFINTCPIHRYFHYISVKKLDPFCTSGILKWFSLLFCRSKTTTYDKCNKGCEKLEYEVAGYTIDRYVVQTLSD